MPDRKRGKKGAVEKPSHYHQLCAKYTSSQQQLEASSAPLSCMGKDSKVASSTTKEQPCSAIQSIPEVVTSK
eukprot:8046558-Prorocentrum_lima.AAC.1